MMKQPLLFRLVPLTTGVLLLIELVLSNHLAGSGLLVRQLELEITRLQDENQQLAQELAGKSSLFTITARAKENGFVLPTKYHTLTPDQYPVALNQSL